MIHRIEHALVMDTDDIPGRGGYAVVGMSEGLTQPERVFVAENFGISDYLHDPQNDRAFYSFLRVPGGRFAFVRRFTKGLRRSGSQSRVFVHTLFLEDETFRALRGLPWLLVEASLRRVGQREWQQLTLDYGPLIDSASFAALEWEMEPDLVDAPQRRFQTRMNLVAKRLPGIDPVEAVGTVMTALQQGRRAVLPQGMVYELLTILGWSMLPICDRMNFAWTQHDSRNVAVDFAIANTPGAAFDVESSPVIRRIVQMNTSDEESWREFHTRAERYPLTIRGDGIAAWLKWRDALMAVGEKLDQPDHVIVKELERLAKSARPNRNDPWIDGEEVLQLLWPNIQRAIDNGRDAAAAMDAWGSRLDRSGLGAVIFREPPATEWLQRVARDLDRVVRDRGGDLLVRFYLFGTEGDERAAPTRAAVAEWIVAGREQIAISTEVLARLAVRLAEDRSPLLANIIDRILDDPNGLITVAKVTPLNQKVGDMVLVVAIKALQRQHVQVAVFVRTTLLAHLEGAPETRRKVNENIASAVAGVLRDDNERFIRFARLLDPPLQTYLSSLVAEWLRTETQQTLPLARQLVVRMAEANHPRNLELVFGLAAAGEPATVWSGVVLGIASDVDLRDDSENAQRVADHLQALGDAPESDLRGLLDAVVSHLSRAGKQQLRVGRTTRAVIETTEPVWSDSPGQIINAVRAVLDAVHGSANAWESIVFRLSRLGGSRQETGRLLLSFWKHIEPADVKNLGAEIIEATLRIHDDSRLALVDLWRPRLGDLPHHPRAERFIEVIRKLEQGGSRDTRIELAHRAIKLGTATRETLIELDEDLWERDFGTYAYEFGIAVGDYAAMPVNGARPSPLERVRRLIHLLNDELVPWTVKFAIEESLPVEVSQLAASEWLQIVQLSPRMLERSGRALMILSRQVGGSGVTDAISALKDLCRERQWNDALDGIAAGRIDTEGWFKRKLKGAWKTRRR